MDWNDHHAETEETPEEYARGEARSEARRKEMEYLVETMIDGKWVSTSPPLSHNKAKKWAYVRCKHDMSGSKWRAWHVNDEKVQMDEEIIHGHV